MDRSQVITHRVLATLFSDGPLEDIGVILWDGSHWPDDGPRRARLILNHPGALRKMFLSGTEFGLAEAYLYDDFDIEGDIESVFKLRAHLADKPTSIIDRFLITWQLLQLPLRQSKLTSQRGRATLAGEEHSIERDRQAIQYHYDVSNDFYALWLDKRLVYSCGYFKSDEDSLDRAHLP